MVGFELRLIGVCAPVRSTGVIRLGLHGWSLFASRGVVSRCQVFCHHFLVQADLMVLRSRLRFTVRAEVWESVQAWAEA